MSSAAAPVFTPQTTGEDVASHFGSAASGKTILITGANAGLGFETARVLASVGADVIVTCRDEKKAQDTAARLLAAVPEAAVSAVVLDLSSLASVRSFVKSFLDARKQLHVLVNNAGVMACPRTETHDGLEMQFGVNHIGHYLLTMNLWPLLAQSGTAASPARIINLSSIGHWLFGPKTGIIFDDLDGKKRYHSWERYGQSKLANVLFSKYLARKAVAENANVVSASLHPGFILETELSKHVGFMNSMSMMGALVCNPGRLCAVLTEGPKNTAQGVATTVYTVLAPELESGAYYADCKVERRKVHPLADDEALAKRLVEVSEEIVKSTAGNTS